MWSKGLPKDVVNLKFCFLCSGSSGAGRAWYRIE